MERWDEELFGGIEAAQPKPAQEKSAKEILPDSSGGRALEENRKAQEKIKADITGATGQAVSIEDIKRKQDALKKLQEDEARIKAGGI